MYVCVCVFQGSCHCKQTLDTIRNFLQLYVGAENLNLGQQALQASTFIQWAISPVLHPILWKKYLKKLEDGKNFHTHRLKEKMAVTKSNL